MNIWKSIVGGMIISFATASVQAQEFRLNWGHYLPNGPFAEIEQGFVDAIEERTNGRVKINIVFAGGLGAGDELLSLTGRGAIDMGAIASGYYPDQLLFTKALQIPFVFDSPEEAVRVANYSFENIPAFTEELEGLNVVRLFEQPLGSFHLIGPSDDCRAFEGLAGKKIRSNGSNIPVMISAADAVPINMAAGDQYEGLERGTLDYGFLTLAQIEAFRLLETGSFICGPFTTFVGHSVVINADVWQRLPQDIKVIFREVASETATRYLDWSNDTEFEAGERLRNSGATIIEMDEDYLSAWHAASPNLLQLWVEELDQRGMGEEAAAVVEEWRTLTAN